MTKKETTTKKKKAAGPVGGRELKLQEKIANLESMNDTLSKRLHDIDEKFIAMQRNHVAGEHAPSEKVKAMQARIQELETGIAKNTLSMKGQKRGPNYQEINVRRHPQVLCDVRNLQSPDCDIDVNYGGMNFRFEDGSRVEMPLCIMKHLASIREPQRVWDQGGPEQDQIRIEGWNYRFSITAVHPSQLADAERIVAEFDGPDTSANAKASPPVKAETPIGVDSKSMQEALQPA